MPVGADGQGRHEGGAQPVAHRVDHGQVQDVVVEGVVEAVPGNVVGRFEGAGDGDLRRGHHQRRQQLPLHLRGQAHRLPAPRLEEPVGVHALGDQDVGHQAGQPSSQPPIMIVNGVEREGEHPDPIGAVEQRDEEPHPVVLRPLDRLICAEGLARQRSVDRLRGPHQQTSPCQRHQGHLVVVLQENLDVPASDDRDLLLDERGDHVRRHLMGPVQQRTEQPLPEPLRPVNHR